MLNDELAEGNQWHPMSALAWIMLVLKIGLWNRILILRHGLKQFTVGVSGSSAFLSALVNSGNV